MTWIIKIAILALCNTLGFLGISLAFYIGQFAQNYGITTALTNPQIETAAFLPLFFQRSIITWGICALFSLSFLFMGGIMRIIALFTPVILPMLYGLSLIFWPLT